MSCATTPALLSSQRQALTFRTSGIAAHTAINASAVSLREQDKLELGYKICRKYHFGYPVRYPSVVNYGRFPANGQKTAALSYEQVTAWRSIAYVEGP